MKVKFLIAKSIATFGGAGLAKKAPGTWGSLAGLVFFAVLHQLFTVDIIFIITVGLFFIGIGVSNILIAEMKEDDPQIIVIDEVVGIFVSLIAVNFSFATAVLGFALFRLFDILKPFPVGLADRKIKGGMGVMLDDVLAGLYAAFFLHLISSFLF